LTTPAGRSFHHLPRQRQPVVFLQTDLAPWATSSNCLAVAMRADRRGWF
jgi:hypothetical protein